MTLSINPSFPTFQDVDGKPLENGYIWIGAENLDPQSNPIAVFWDAALTQAAAQPIRTNGGYPVNAGTPATIYAGVAYSIRVMDKKGRIVYSSPSETLFLDSSHVRFVQSGAGAVLRTLQDKNRDFKSVSDFSGIDLTGATDSTAGLQAALDSCNLSGHKLIGVPGTCLISATLRIECSCDLSVMTLNVNAAAVSTAVRVGSNTPGGDQLFKADVILPRLNNTAKTVAGWTGFDASIGVELANLYESRITVPYVRGFGVNLKEGGYGTGCVYNTINIGILEDGKINQQLKPGDANGWANQNTHIGGRWKYNSAEGVAVTGVIQIQLRDFDGTGPNAPNNNTWVNPSVEGNEPQFHYDIQGTVNTFITPRGEVPSGTCRVNWHAVVANETLDNNIIGGYDADGFTYTTSGAGTSSRNKRILGSRGDTLEYTAHGLNLNNRTSNASGAPHLQGFPASVTALGKTNLSTDWTYRLYGDGMSYKQTADTQDRLQLLTSGHIYFGRGSVAPTAFIRAGSSAGEINCGAAFLPEGTRNLGASSLRWSSFFVDTIRVGSAQVTWTSGSGSPEGVVSAVVGSMYTRTDGGAGTTLYVKESGAGNTGWIAK